MSYRHLQHAIGEVTLWFQQQKIPYALIGGLAVSFRTIERATRDIDFVVAVKNDSEAEDIVRSLKELDYFPEAVLENKSKNLLSTVRLLKQPTGTVYLDMLFASSGIEHEVVKDATLIDILPSLSVYIASISGLIALKTLSANDTDRIQDLLDLKNLFYSATEIELAKALEFLRLI